jgi:thioredoxin reductase
MHDLLVLGGGPAGLTATVYAIQKRMDVLMISRDLGGKTNNHLKLPFIERHMTINGDEVINRFVNEIKYLEYIHLLDNVEQVNAINGGFSVTTTGQEQIEARALIIATGVKGEMLNIPGEREYLMHGLCYSAISYAQLMIDRTVAVIGDGSLALRAVAELARSSYHVTLIASVPNQLDTPLGQHLRLLRNVTFLEGYTPSEVRGDQFARCIVVSGPNGVKQIATDAIFVEKELTPRSDLFAHLVEREPTGHIKINLRNETSTTGVFAAGDVTNSYSEQVLISIGEGAKAALSAYNYLLQNNLLKEYNHTVAEKMPH